MAGGAEEEGEGAGWRGDASPSLSRGARAPIERLEHEAKGSEAAVVFFVEVSSSRPPTNADRHDSVRVLRLPLSPSPASVTVLSTPQRCLQKHKETDPTQ